jgi:hypothetical protein
MSKRLSGLLFIFTFLSIQAQEVTIKGKVMDSLQQPLAFANIMAENIQAQTPPVFAMTDENGNYHIRLLKKYSYQVSVLYMGYRPQRFTIDSLSQSITKNIVLKPQENQLDEIVITADMPVKVKEDTITYKTDHFKTGGERKLKDILKKLPGIEVDKNGKISVLGKKVSSVLVEGKEFFGGNSKLAVENIPADAVDKVIAIDDYSSIGFMKGLTDEQKMILNIKLKEGKKRFVFGDITAGAGEKEHYLAKANLFYYSPKTNLSYIGNLNNTGESPMSLDDFIRFESSSMDLEKLRSSFQNFKNISSIIMPGQFLNKKDHFHAMQWQQDFGEKVEWTSYAIYAKNNTGFHQLNENFYQYNAIIEEKENIKEQNNLTGLGKVHFRHKKNFFNYFDASLYIQNLQSQSSNTIFSSINQTQNHISHQKKDDNFSINSYLGWHHQFNKHHTVRWQNTFNFKHYLPNDYWQSNQSVFNAMLPLQNDVLYTIGQDMDKKSMEWNTEFKHYWIRNINHHIYFTIENHWSQQNFNSQTWQQLSNGNVNSFQNSGFNNDLQIQLNDAVGGIQYKVRHWKSIFKFGLFSHYITWNFKGDQHLFDKAFYMAPEFLFEKKIGYSRQIKFKYQVKNTLFPILKYATNYYLSDYNKVTTGNINIRNELAHHLTLNFRDFSIANNYQYYINLSYQQKIKPISTRIVYQDIQSFSMPVILQDPANTLNTQFFIKYDFKKIYIEMHQTFFYNTYQQYVQNILTKSQFLSQQYEWGIGSYFKKYPNFDLGTTYGKSTYRINRSDNKTKNIGPFLELSYDFKNAFIFKFKYQHHYIITDFSTQKNDYQKAEFNLIYQKENKAWGFEISASNLFNNRFINSTNQSDILLTNQFIYIQPRILLFKIHYKL